MERAQSVQAHGAAHKKVADRLARAEGHLGAVLRMWEEGRGCVEVLTQIAAVRAALDKVARIILEAHMEKCVVQAIKEGSGEQSLAELQEALSRIL